MSAPHHRPLRRIGPETRVAAEIDVTTAHPARIYDYLLGGKENFPADRDAAEALLAVVPQAREGARENRGFLQRAVRYLAGEAGIRQFLDIGTGLPTQGNVHEVAGAIAPDARVVYVDNDPLVHVHANALLAGERSTSVLADLRGPEAILSHPMVRAAIDFEEPVALLLVAVLHFLTDDERPERIVARLAEAMAPGSYLVVSHATSDFHPELAAHAKKVYAEASAPLVPRSRSQIEGFFAGFELVPPGLVQPAAWRPELAREGPACSETGVGVGGFYAGVGRKRGPAA